MSDSSDASPQVHLSQFYDALVEIRAAVDVLFDTLAYMEAGNDEERFRSFKEALYERHEHAKEEHLQRIAEAMESGDLDADDILSMKPDATDADSTEPPDAQAEQSG
jgi:hypothetical protein